MATKGKNKAVALSIVTLAMIVAAGEAGMFTAPAVHAPMVADGTVEINPNAVNEAGEIATRATQKGIESVNTQANTNTAPTASKSSFVIESDVVMPTAKRGGRSGSVYPFDELAVGQSFFVANTEDKPDMAKSLASTVSSATARYAVDSGETEVVEVKQYQIDSATGKRAKDADGHLIVVATVKETRAKMNETRKFVVRSFEQNGVAGARVWRTA